MEKHSNNQKKSRITVKVPTQKRSQETVDAILDACARLLVSEGFYAITTDKIAKEADVSIGSLYQFFGNKESVVQSLVKRLIDEEEVLLIEKEKELAGLPKEQHLDKIIQIGLDIGARNLELRSKLYTVKYYVAEPTYIFSRLKIYQDLLLKHLPETSDRDREKVTFVFMITFMGLINTLAIYDITAMRDPGISKEITHMFKKFIQS